MGWCSMRCETTGPEQTIGAAGATESVAEQMGQASDEEVVSAKSAQKCSCAPTKATTRSSTKSGNLRLELRMYLIRLSLGKKGCWVKDVPGFQDSNRLAKLYV